MARFILYLGNKTVISNNLLPGRVDLVFSSFAPLVFTNESHIFPGEANLVFSTFVPNVFINENRISNNVDLVLSTSIPNVSRSNVFDTDTWNGTQGGAKFTLSNGDLTATAVDINQTDTIISLISRTTGKWYFEITAGSGADLAWGLAQSSQSNFTTGWTTGVQLRHTGNWRINSTETASGAGGVTNATLGFAVDKDNDRIYFRRTASPTAWFGNGSGADPVAGTGGFDISTRTGLALFICFTSNQNGNNQTSIMNAGPSGFDATAPSGYLPWGDNSTSPSSTELNFSTFVPSVNIQININPDKVDLILSGFVPLVVRIEDYVVVSWVDVSAQLAAPIVIEVDNFNLIFTTFVPDVLAINIKEIPNSNLVITTSAPKLTFNVDLSITSSGLFLDTLAPNVLILDPGNYVPPSVGLNFSTFSIKAKTTNWVPERSIKILGNTENEIILIEIDLWQSSSSGSGSGSGSETASGVFYVEFQPLAFELGGGGDNEYSACFGICGLDFDLTNPIVIDSFIAQGEFGAVLTMGGTIFRSWGDPTNPGFPNPPTPAVNDVWGMVIDTINGFLYFANITQAPNDWAGSGAFGSANPVAGTGGYNFRTGTGLIGNVYLCAGGSQPGNANNHFPSVRVNSGGSAFVGVMPSVCEMFNSSAIWNDDDMAPELSLSGGGLTVSVNSQITGTNQPTAFVRSNKFREQ